MGEERLANLARMHIHRARTLAIPKNEIQNIFLKKSPRYLEYKIVEGQIVFIIILNSVDVVFSGFLKFYSIFIMSKIMSKKLRNSKNSLLYFL